MKIVLATEEDIKPVADRYLVLELDTFRIKGKEIPSWCIVDAGDVGLADMTELAHFKEQHENLIFILLMIHYLVVVCQPFLQCDPVHHFAYPNCEQLIAQVYPHALLGYCLLQ